jgi:adenosylmethionine-8-amino-7-oxononanoate aminotransferase
MTARRPPRPRPQSRPGWFDEGFRHIWMPYTQMQTAPEPEAVKATRGTRIILSDGRELIDGIASWWSACHGYNHPHIQGAVVHQLERMPHVMLGGLANRPAFTLARRLAAMAPGTLNRVFFSESGSVAVEVAIKMAVQYWLNRGQAKRRRLVCFDGAYHGDTIGAMSVGARGIFNAPYEPLLFDVGRIPFPGAGHEQDAIDVLDAVCAEGNVAALIVEPLILGAGGMLIYSAETLAEMKRVCDRHGVLLIADEVMTGWGRTGTLLACEQAGVTPDILCLAKGLTGGALPLAVTLCSEPVFEAHLSPDRSKTFFHSSSYTANPIACAAAVANLEVWEREPVGKRIEALALAQAERLKTFENDARFRNVRRLGTIAALDLDVGDHGYLAGIGPKLYAAVLERGVLLRPLGNTIYLMPPYCTTPEELDLAYDAITAAADRIGETAA